MSARPALQRWRHSTPNGTGVLVLDLMLPNGGGLTLLSELLKVGTGTRVIVITATASIHRAVTAMRLGADDVLIKPLDADRLLRAADTASAARREDMGKRAAAPAGPEDATPAMIGTVPAMVDLRRRMARAGGVARAGFRDGRERHRKGAVRGRRARALGPREKRPSCRSTAVRSRTS